MAAAAAASARSGTARTLRGMITVDGNIAAGKTTAIEHGLRDANGRRATAHLEKSADETPLLRELYAQAEHGSLVLQAYMLALRMLTYCAAIVEAATHGTIAVIDRSVAFDVMFARATLAPPDLDTYMALYDRAMRALPRPGHVIVLTADAMTCFARMRTRNVAVEVSAVNLHYLCTLESAFAEVVAGLAAHTCTVGVVPPMSGQSEAADFVRAFVGQQPPPCDIQKDAAAFLRSGEMHDVDDVVTDCIAIVRMGESSVAERAADALQESLADMQRRRRDWASSGDATSTPRRLDRASE